MKVGVVGNPRYTDLRGLLEKLQSVAPAHDIQLFSEQGLAELWSRPVPDLAQVGGNLDLMISFGGDGTLLRAARLTASQAVPILGVNLGLIGFLTTSTPETLEETLTAFVRGEHLLEHRRTLETTILREDSTEARGGPALNDVVVHKAGVARVIRLKVGVDGDEVGEYSADGIIVATPTGSTAYSLSAGGPIVIPGVNALIITAICPHTLSVRPIIVPGQSTVTVGFVPPWTEDDFLVSFDGQVGAQLHHHDRVVVRSPERGIQLVRVESEGFFDRMWRKLQWGDLTDRRRT